MVNHWNVEFKKKLKLGVLVMQNRISSAEDIFPNPSFNSVKTSEYS